MKRSFALSLSALLLAASLPALALPKMEITAAKKALYKRKNTPTAVEFNSRRVSDLPNFDRLGIGNYRATYKLDNEQTLMVWLYVEDQPPNVDEAVLYITPATPQDVRHERALKLLQIVYGESLSGSRVVQDFEKARDREVLNKYKLPAERFIDGSLLPPDYDGGLYYLGDQYGYKVRYNKKGLEVSIHRDDAWEKFIMDTIQHKRYPMPTPTPTPFPTPTPGPTPNPTITW